MDFDEVVKRRHMTRAFRKTPIPETALREILETAWRAPSAGHLQPWEFIIVNSDERKLKLARAALNQMWIREAPLVIVTCANTRRVAGRYGRRGIELYSVVDTAFASLLILLKCTSMRLGASFVGAFDDSEVARILRLPDYVRPVGIISIGYPAEKANRYPRIPLKEIVHYESW